MTAMRTPDASSVTVALSTLVAITTVAVVLSQLVPADRAGAVLPVSPITIVGESASPNADTPVPVDPAPAGSSNIGGAPVSEPKPTVVAPAPAQAVEPQPTTPVTTPGNSANAPGHGGTSPSEDQNTGKP